MGATTRTFLAVELPEASRRAIEALQRSFEPRVAGLRWTDPALFHLTLAFLGDVPTGGLERLGDAVVQAVSAYPRFGLELKGLGAFPDPNRARVLWVGIVGDALNSLDALQRSVVEAAATAGHPPTDDRFHPHVTIARSKAGRGPSPNLLELCDQHRAWSPGALPVEEVVVMASELTPRGPTYRVVRSAPLAGASP
ncbi:RNA 2',3'-cyclic phosphodiesterase [Tautonia sp. JC769]|uniref:RNA 2',3'-cyclic phosphodiesterase n=1 Tax=Tautonia sp. JC769 TaxID=3232135 RepID=UPI003459CA83